jgi:tRNA-dihydrouridine synthase
VEPEDIIEKLGGLAAAEGWPQPARSAISGVLVGRGVLRNPWILSQAADLVAGRSPRTITLAERGQFLLDYIQLLVNERVDEARGFRHVAPGTLEGQAVVTLPTARGRERWVINKIRALCSWYSKGFDGGSHFRVRVNSCGSLDGLRDIIGEFFFVQAVPAGSPRDADRLAPTA